MNVVHVLTVKSAASGDRVQRSFLGDRSFSKHLLHTQMNFSLLSICNRNSVLLLFWLLGRPVDHTALRIYSRPSQDYELSFGT